MKAEKEGITCLINVTQRGRVKTSAQVLLKGIKGKSPVQDPVTTDAGWKKEHCLCKTEMIPGGWKIKIEVSLTQYHPDPVGYHMEEKEKIPGGGQYIINILLITPNVNMAVLRG